eukprot:3036131-Pleurochrysis_carterae.AAC.1
MRIAESRSRQPLVMQHPVRRLLVQASTVCAAAAALADATRGSASGLNPARLLASVHALWALA